MVVVVEVPVVLGGDMTVAEVVLGFDGFGFGAGDGNDEVIIGEIEAGKIELAEGAEEFAEGFGENLEPAGADVGVGEPGDALLAVLGSVDGGVGVKAVEFEEDFFGAARGGEPVADEGDFGVCVRMLAHLAPLWVMTTRAVRKIIWRSNRGDQFWM